MESRDPAFSSDTLNGWKEIAAHIGKSVRAAQRWERELGLPVRRLKTPNSQIVFASKQEIDAWRRRLEVEPAGGAPALKRPAADARANPLAAPEPAAPRGPARVGWLWAALATLAVLALLVWLRR